MNDIGPCILEEEVATAIKELKNNKAKGIDEIPAELLKCMGNTHWRFSHICAKKIMKQENGQLIFYTDRYHSIIEETECYGM